MIVSIFNDIIGPAMRGPSSSHCAAALRIGRIARDLMGSEFKEVLIEFAKNSALATTHDSHGSDMGLFGGLLGLELTDEKLIFSRDLLESSGVKIDIRIVDIFDEHPNTYRIFLKNSEQEHSFEAISVGGGIIEATRIDNFPISISGDYYETLLWVENQEAEIKRRIKAVYDDQNIDNVLIHEDARSKVFLIEIKSIQQPGDDLIKGLKRSLLVKELKIIKPVLPVLSGKNIRVPFNNAEEMLNCVGASDIPLWQLAIEYEKQRARLSEAEVIERMIEIVRIIRSSISAGIAGTAYEDRLLPPQSGRYLEQLKTGRFLNAGILNRAIAYVSALMEVKSSMGVIVAAPTAGACATLPGTVVAVAEELDLSEKEMAKGLLAAGLIGVFIANQATFSAEIGGCQAETGSASSMAAAALVTLAKGNLKQSLAAASMALQNMLGLICDPVANRVEVPCLGRNLSAASNAIVCANLALADYDQVIPLDEVIEAAFRVGKQLPRELRCTGLGGLSTTKTSLELERKLRIKSD